MAEKRVRDKNGRDKKARRGGIYAAKSWRGQEHELMVDVVHVLSTQYDVHA